MSGINTNRWLLGGIAAGVLLWLLEGAASQLYMEDMQTALAARNISLQMTAGVWIWSVVVSLMLGLALVFLYAAARPRFGPGPRTAAIVAFALWVGGYVPSLIGYNMIGLYPNNLLVLWAVVGLVQLIVAGIVGAWLYREA
ncbi:MAG: hypothetical protein ACT4R6_00195 [Gemmatimonadaceae bacterium]